MDLNQANALSQAMSALATAELLERLEVKAGEIPGGLASDARVHLDLVKELIASGATTSAPATGGKLCEACGQVEVSGTFAKCYACFHNPGRKVGVCMECGKGCKPDFAVCWTCKNGPVATETQAAPEPATQAAASIDDQDEDLF